MWVDAFNNSSFKQYRRYGGKKMSTNVKFDFGNSSVPTESGYCKVERVYQSPRYMWITETLNQWRDRHLSAPLKDFLYGKKGEFRVGLPKGIYQIKLYFFDPLQSWDAFKVVCSAVEADASALTGTPYCTVEIQVDKNRLLEQEIMIEHKGGVLAFSFVGIGSGGRYMVNGLEITSDSPFQLQSMYPQAPSDKLPSVHDVEKKVSMNQTSMMHILCQWLVEHRTADGFLGDYEGSQRLWYTASYPIRTLLAGYHLLGNKEYIEIATEILDLLVVEQMPEGAFTQAYRQQKTNELTEVELEEVRKNNWMNLADVGSMMAAMAIACRYVDKQRKEIYITSLRRYLDKWAMRFRHQSGGFNNGWIRGFAENIYSVSTATTALTMMFFSQLTGEEKYMKIGEDAVLFLTQDWNEDGRNLNWIFDGTFPGENHYQDVLDFGDTFYVIEALSAALALTKRPQLKKIIYDAIQNHLFGSTGLLKNKANQTWWSIQNTWNNSKSVAMPIILQDFQLYADEMNASQEKIDYVKKEYENCMKFLCIPKYARILGVMSNDPIEKLPFGPHSLQSWTGCAVAATGFAGITLAQMIKPGIIYLK